MKREVLIIFIVILLLPFSNAQLTSLEIISVKVNENAIEVLIDNKLGYNVIKETFIINNQYTIIQEIELKNLESKPFTVYYPSGIKLENLQVIIGDSSTSYTFTGTEETFDSQQNIVQQESSQVVAVQESNSPISYIYSSQRLAKIQDNNVIYFISDNIGSTSLETDSSGSISFKANYLPFGKKLSFSSIGKEKYGFTSKEYDYESSLNYFNARYYNPNNGKFISNDPIFKSSEGGYQYVNNNPLTLIDPSGKQLTEEQWQKGLKEVRNNPLFKALEENRKQERKKAEALENAEKIPGYVSPGLRQIILDFHQSRKDIENAQDALNDAFINLGMLIATLQGLSPEDLEKGSDEIFANLEKSLSEEQISEIIEGYLKIDEAREALIVAETDSNKLKILYDVLPAVIIMERSNPITIKTRDIKPIPLPERFDDETAKIFRDIFK